MRWAKLLRSLYKYKADYSRTYDNIITYGRSELVGFVRLCQSIYDFDYNKPC